MGKTVPFSKDSMNAELDEFTDRLVERGLKSANYEKLNDGEKRRLADVAARIKQAVAEVKSVIEDHPQHSVQIHALNELYNALAYAFEIGSTATLTPQVAAFAKCEQAAQGRNGRALHNAPRVAALESAIASVLNGHRPTQRFSKEAAAILTPVNEWLVARRHKPAKVDVIRRRLEKRSGEIPRS